MLELLPKNQKKALKREYFLRVLAVALLMLSAVGAPSLVSLSPSYFLSLEKEKIVAKQFAEIEKSRKIIMDDKEFQSDIKNLKEVIDLLKPFEKTISIGDFIANIVSNKNYEIKIYSITANYYKKDKYQIIVNGNAINRDMLKSFVENLKGSNLFENVNLPISNFTKITDIDFGITLITAI